jgi:hypothetical protein
MDRRRQPSGAAAAQAPCRGRHLDRARSSRADQASARSSGDLRPGRRWPPLRRCAGRRAAHDHLPSRLGQARQLALTPAEQASPPARRPHDLRHACLSTWLNGGVYSTQVAEWPGTAWKCCCASTPSASRARTISPSAASTKPCARSESPELWRVFGTATCICWLRAAHSRTPSELPRSRNASISAGHRRTISAD